MNLDKERRIKSWFFGFTKIAGAFLIILKIFQFFYSDNNEKNPSDVTPELDSLELANPLEGKKEEGLVKTVSSLQKDNTFKTKDKDYGESPKSNTLSILIYGQNGLDHEIINHLEDTLFSSYELVLTDPLDN
ncbi:hypothetical protein [Maribacter cobaltidurans]|uniref:Uncharacterized protein n=1 Tax=Maribacter cobaltidurans TaxID=1178778 RepID=A0A223V6J0_9FLAO|nr:hypothetical protein [Maribacter cobaltidurans]ASV30817.1 hypothetical protein CJ263_11640 [Maribacter cobaltidurans]GGD81990.1 hypothetical protein GCM10011412_19740 [Maribacter cobaltidurans]